MIRDGSDIPDGTDVPRTQVCIIGSGVAGITAAWELQKAGIKVILLEGSRDYRDKTLEDSWPDKVLLYDGQTGGLFSQNEPEFLILPYEDRQPVWERERIFGGTSSHWGGQCRPHDPIDFEARDDFPGWPVNRDELDPFYRRASALCGLEGDYGPHGDNFTAQYWADKLRAQVPQLPGFDAEMYQFMGGSFKRFATRTFDGNGTIGDTSVDIILNASVLEIRTDSTGVTSLLVGSMTKDIPPKKDTTFTITADAYVLACGAVANAQQLLASKIGNDHVGRYFMCHPLVQPSVIHTPTDYLTWSEGRFMDGADMSGQGWTNANGVTVSARFIPNPEETRKRRIGRCWFWYHIPYSQFYFEMAPNPDSRITLLTGKDDVDKVFGRPQIKIDWQLSPTDERTYKETTAMFKNAVTNALVPRWEDLQHFLVVNGHHMGTTRMSTDPAQGVVDKNLQVHKLSNLFVAGSSVFPTGAISNPTFTIIALSIRLADHLKGVKGSA